jgi:hypothetical protein
MRCDGPGIGHPERDVFASYDARLFWLSADHTSDEPPPLWDSSPFISGNDDENLRRQITLLFCYADQQPRLGGCLGKIWPVTIRRIPNWSVVLPLTLLSACLLLSKPRKKETGHRIKPTTP